MLVAAIAVLRLVELALSRHGLHRTRTQGGAEVMPERVFPLMVALHASWLLASLVEPWLLGGAAGFIHASAVFWPAAGAWVVALALRLWMLQAMGWYWSVRLVRRPEQPVVTSGPYRYVRHPNYLAVILEIAAVPLMTGAYWTALAWSAANGAMLWFRIRGEEAYLLESPAYRDAFADKKRFIPGVF